MHADAIPSATAHAALAPSRWIVRFAHLITGPRVLDLACGSGRHARYLALRGHRVIAVDRDEAMLASLADAQGVETRCIDLEQGGWPLAGETFDGIVVTNYLHRPLLPHLVSALVPDGALLYETFAVGNEAFGRPSNPDFLLAPGELLDTIGSSLAVIAFEQGRIDEDGRSVIVQRIAAVGPARCWPSALDPVRA